MPQLIQIRNKIRSIETIKKITHATRLISMAAHSQLNHQAQFIRNYKKELSNILEIIQLFAKEPTTQITTNEEQKAERTLIIIVGTQKGLAGTFNSSLFHFFEKSIKTKQVENIDYICVGKKASDYLKKRESILKSFDNFNTQTLNDITFEIFETINKAIPSYTNVICYSNNPKSFFLQAPEETALIPTVIDTNKKNNLKNENLTIDLEQYVWEQNPHEIFKYLDLEYLNFNILLLLFNSLLAEQAARFQSMDNATKNAEDLLETLKRQYNKLRQSKITKEITEVSGSAL